MGKETLKNLITGLCVATLLSVSGFFLTGCGGDEEIEEQVTTTLEQNEEQMPTTTQPPGSAQSSPGNTERETTQSE